MGYRIGVDVGGSFTDFAVLDETSGEMLALKVFSRPEEPGAEILAGLAALAERDGVTPAQVGYFTHGTTVGVNTVIQRSGPKLALFATAGFEDVLEVARLKIPEINNLYSRRPAPLIPRERVFGIAERIGADGKPQRAPGRADVAAHLAEAQARGAEGVVIAFLHAYRNPAHEDAVRAMLAELAPGLPVVTSSGTWPVIREYERSVTAVISGYVQPQVANYLDRFEAALAEAGVGVPAHITKSNGGVMALDQARAEPVQMILSGTASGVIGAGHLARHCGFDRILSLDIGGTSADVAVILDGVPQFGTGELIGEFQIHIPSVAVTSVGQGGGSVAALDGLGVLKVGPESAGSTPGPACYGRGGTRPTVTDAMAAANLIGHGALGYGAVSVDHGAARAAIAPLAEGLGATVEEVAASIVEIAVSSMYAEISGLISRFGIDPREFHLFAFGGAGAMLACFVARELDMKGVVVPPRPGVISALGGVIADLRNDFIRTLFLDLDEAGVRALAAPLAELEETGRAWLAEQGHDGPAAISVSADMRYAGQSFEIEAPLEAGWIAAGNAGAIAQAFHAEHDRLFGHANPHAPVQLVNLRLVVSGPTPKPAIPRPAPAEGPAMPERHVTGWFDGLAHEVPLYQRADLRPGHRLAGPAIVGQEDTTTVLPPDFALEVDAFGNLVLTRAPRA
ncbi:hydantoinase/oxoprolinase family protein [Paralimibaculum aggregatum]|uniref:Hydantoinase/oxoprolinase family protein n=1 Tax=Paralimibaculum aggregatum TaxID=3036245 RepID=A0ABQ6LP69_9RHOB|nr:hydantoinase/oxoprolinase family protein [Limibaculum sp. NKW23]GMG83053.1 hydantoinase/oxoprolinase family protein [Limibaculum sp. NKW23]